MLDGGALVDWLRNQNYAVPLLRAAPDRIDGLAAGRPEFHRGDCQGSSRPGTAIRPECLRPSATGWPWRQLSRRLPVRDVGRTRRRRSGSVSGLSRLGATREGVGGWAYFNEDCRDVWKVPAAPEAMRQPVASAIPTLLISGSFDTLTSLAGAKAAAEKLSSATIISIPGIGHFVSPNSPCAQRVIVSFLADPAAPDASCVAGLTPQTFAAPESP